MVSPKPIFKGYVLKEDVELSAATATEFWLGNVGGNSFYIRWWGNGWVIQFTESFLCKSRSWKHKSEIPSFEYSRYGEGWEHVYATKEEAAEFYRTHTFPQHAESEEFYSKVYDILMTLGGAPDGEYRKAFMFNFSKKEKFPDREWRFQGHLGFGGKYRNETNRVDCYQEDETPERLAIIEKINAALKELEDEKEATNVE